MNPIIHIQRKTELVDEQIHIEIVGLHVGKLYEVRAEMKDDSGRLWQSHATFEADLSGRIDPSSQAPKFGTYEGIDQAGLLWSMKLHAEPSQLSYENIGTFPFFIKGNVSPQEITVSLYLEDEWIAQTEIIAKYVVGQLTVEEVHTDFVGKFFVPTNAASLPTVIVVGGSGGGLYWSEQVAAILASRGFAAMAVAYYDYYGNYGLPNELVNIPIENFASCINWLRGRREVNGDSIGIIGISKGGELALLLGSMFPEDLKTAVAFNGSMYMLQGIRIGSDEKLASWSYNGKPFGFLSYPDSYQSSMDFDKSKLHEIHTWTIQNATDAEKEHARIPVERIQGNLLLITGDKDETGPTSDMSAEIVQIIQRNSSHCNVTHLRYPEAGHGFHIPNLPPNSLAPHVAVSDIARAERDAWGKMLTFLREHL